MTIASPSRVLVADIKWVLREFQRFPPSISKKFRERIDPRSFASLRMTFQVLAPRHHLKKKTS